jgi:hypothetical protein
MAITFDELLEKLKQEEETLLVDVLEIQSNDIVNRFEDFITNRLDYLLNEYSEEDSDSREEDGYE